MPDGRRVVPTFVQPSVFGPRLVGIPSNSLVITDDWWVYTALLTALKDAAPTSPEFQKAQAGVLKQLQNAIRDMKKKYPDARATASAIEIGEKYGLNVK